MTVVPGGARPDDNRMLLIAGEIDFFMSADALISLDAVADDVPLVTVAAVYGEEPHVLR